MNEQNTRLDDLANGYVTRSCPTPLSAEVLNALAASVVTNRRVAQISTPVVAKTIDLGALHAGTENQPEFTFTNNTGVDIIYWFTGLWNTPGSANDFGISGNSAFDYPGAQGSGNAPENGGSDLRVFNKKVIALGGYIVDYVEVETSNTGAQKRQRLRVVTENVQNDPCEARVLAPLCPTCPDNNGSDVFVGRFNGPLGVGGNASFGYTVLDGETVTIRLNVIGEAVSQFRSIGAASC